MAIGKLNRDFLTGLKIGGRSHDGPCFLAHDRVATMKNRLGIEGRELLLQQLTVLSRFVETLLSRLGQASPQPGDRLTFFLELAIEAALLKALLKAAQAVAVLSEIDLDRAAQTIGTFAMFSPQVL